MTTVRGGKEGHPRDSAASIKLLIEEREESVNSIHGSEVWLEVEMIVDSGASGTLVGGSMVKAVEAKNVRNDIKFKLADGSKVPPMGKRLSQPTQTKDTFAKW